MIRLLPIALLVLPPLLHAEEAHDLLRFNNGDQLHGEFHGIEKGPTLIWQRKDLNETAKFRVNNLRHVVLRGGNPEAPLKSISLVELVNGDQIPGTITALTEKEVTIDTSCAGKLTIERNKVARIAPQPLGGRLHYHGPFSTDRWDVVSYNPDNDEDQEQEQEIEVQVDGDARQGRIEVQGLRGRIRIAPDGQEAAPPEDEDQGADWQHAGAAWYWKSSNPGTALILRDTMPKRSTLRFDMAWKNQLNVAIAIHADFCVDNPVPKQGEEANDKQAVERPQFIAHDSSSLPAIFGNAFILQIHSNYMVIYRSMVDKEGNKSIKRVQTASSRLNIGENAASSFELRSDLENSTYSLFVNGKFVTQWTDPALKNENFPALDGASLAFMPQIANAQVKISDVIIAEWNGMPDSARSLQVDDQDIIVMTNGLDRLAGQAISLEANQMLRFKGKHGEFLLPLDEIAELRMAGEDLVDYEAPSGQQVKVRFSPMGVISGTPLSGDRKLLVLDHPLAGDISIHNESAVMLEFDDSNEIFTDWDANF